MEHKPTRKPNSVYVNSEYVKKYISEYVVKKRTTRTALCNRIGRSPGYIAKSIQQESMDISIMKFLCEATGMDYCLATTNPHEIQRNTNETVSTENAELIISYIQDLGKILGDIAREVREERTQTSGLLEKIYKEMHEISMYQKSETIEKRKVQGAINNAVQQVNNTTQAMLGVIRARK